MKTLTRNIADEIMTTLVYIALSSDKYTDEEINVDIAEIVAELKDFEHKFSRFLPDSELSKLNACDYTKVSDEMLAILDTCKKYHTHTKGLFDPTIHNALINEGYHLSKSKGFYNEKQHTHSSTTAANFDLVKIDYTNKTVAKPKNIKIDLGGIGKGYIIDAIANKLKKKYADFCISLGGDIYVAGYDQINNYPYWAIEIENPFAHKLDTPTLIVSDKAIATSGINKRVWQKYGQPKHHIIDPRTAQSSQTNLACTTVIGESTITCDIVAKMLLIHGADKGLEYCESNNIAAIFITKESKIIYTQKAHEYVWKD